MRQRVGGAAGGGGDQNTGCRQRLKEKVAYAPVEKGSLFAAVRSRLDVSTVEAEWGLAATIPQPHG